ncbi:MAG: HEAT repeat domain-containing protein [Opitutaceae bacterium]|jgi:HEAT repeat protein|nr:HEAT repeat domain-containing protein [Opitutaceae bacterium]
MPAHPRSCTPLRVLPVLALLCAAILPARSLLAAESAPTLAPLAAYDYGQPLAPLIDYETWLHAATPAQRAAAEDEILALLATPDPAIPTPATATTTAPAAPAATILTPAARRVFIDWLGVIGTAKSAPALALLAANPDYTFHAARSLATIPGEEAEKALLALLGDPLPCPPTEVPIRVAAANALGQRRAENAVNALANHFGGNYTTAVSAAARDALANIGTLRTLDVLRPTASKAHGPGFPRYYPYIRAKHLPSVRAFIAASGNHVHRAPPSEKNAAIAHVKNRLVETLSDAIDPQVKIETIRALFAFDAEIKRTATSTPAPTAGLSPYDSILITSIFTPPDTAFSESAVAALLADPDPRLRAAIARGLAASSDPASVKLLRDQFPALPPDTQLAALNAIASSRNAAALPVIGPVLAGVGVNSAEIRCAAVRAAAATGDAGVIPALLAALEDGDPAIANAAQNALETLPLENANTPLVELFGHSLPADTHARIITILAARQCRDAFIFALASTTAEVPALRAAAFAALARLVRPGDLADILDIAGNIRAAADRREWRRALFTAAGDAPAPASAATALSAAIARATGPERAALIGALTLVNAPAATDTLQTLLAAPDAAVRKETLRALSAAQTPEACKLLLAAARNGAAPDERTLALIGAIATLEKLDQPAAAKIGEYRAAWPLATRDEERQAIIAAVKKIRAPSATAFLKEIAPADK